MRTRSTATTAAIACALALTLAGCSGDDGDGGGSDGADATATGGASARPTQPTGAIKELSGINCRRGDAGWNFVATVKNGGKESMTYTVTASVADKESGDVLGSKVFTETVAAGQSKQLRADAFYAGDEQDVICVPSATKAVAGG